MPNKEFKVKHGLIVEDGDTVVGSILVRADSTYNIGTTDNRVSNIYTDTLYSTTANISTLISTDIDTGVDATLFFKINNTWKWAIENATGRLMPNGNGVLNIGSNYERVNAIWANKIGNLTSNGLVKTSNSDGTLSVDETAYYKAYDNVSIGTIRSTAVTSGWVVSDGAGIFSTVSGHSEQVEIASATNTINLSLAPKGIEYIHLYKNGLALRRTIDYTVSTNTITLTGGRDNFEPSDDVYVEYYY